ncbi:MAG: NAD-dependent epimerase/dehydratase family protein, partial [Candidatus Omnitrophota bacterium]|nr:NAD-dependent epimerase/dehydratase family protein [Candidatus Omnitrophota bacterium]
LNTDVRIADITDKKTLKTAMEGVDTVFHCAAIVGEWISKDKAEKINVEGTRNLLEAGVDAGVKKFIYLSSLAVLGMRDHYNTPPEAPYGFTGDAYSDTKIKSEKLVMDFYRGHGLPVVIVRPGFVFGPGDKKFLPRMLKLLKEKKFMFLGSGKNIMNLIFIDNLIDVLIKAGLKEKAAGRIYNVTNKDKLTMKEFVFMLSDILKFERPRKSIPIPLAKFIALSMESYGRLTRKKKAPFLTKARIKVASLNLDFDISKTIDDLDYTSRVSIKEGLEKTLRP